MSSVRAPRGLNWLSTLIGFDTTRRCSNVALINDVDANLRSLGIEPLVVPSSDKSKANPFATPSAADGSTHGGVMLSGHTDVVPVDGQDWHSAPFTAEVRDRRLYSRGSHQISLSPMS